MYAANVVVKHLHFHQSPQTLSRVPTLKEIAVASRSWVHGGLSHLGRVRIIWVGSVSLGWGLCPMGGVSITWVGSVFPEWGPSVSPEQGPCLLRGLCVT